MLLALVCTACSEESQLNSHREKIESLQSTTAAIAGAWLAGDISRTYAVTALDQTFVLIQQERAEVEEDARALADPRREQLSRRAETLARLSSAMRRDIQAGDAAALRQRQ